MVDPLVVANGVGLLAFAVAGALKGAEADLDLFGVAVLGLLTAFGGGAIRDVLVGRTPVTFLRTTDVLIAVAGVGVAVLLAWRVGQVASHPALLAADAVGLAAFAATGALVGLRAGVSPFGVVVLATLTGVGGGSLSDLLLTRVPSVLYEDFYATPATLGGATLWVVATLGVPAPVPTATCVAVTLVVRALALRFDWRLPTL